MRAVAVCVVGGCEGEGGEGGAGVRAKKSMPQKEARRKHHLDLGDERRTAVATRTAGTFYTRLKRWQTSRAGWVGGRSDRSIRIWGPRSARTRAMHDDQGTPTTHCAAVA